MAKIRPGSRDEGDMPGQDSFLDIVSNIVGILILLVMVMGVRASYVTETPEPTPKAIPAEPIAEETPPAEDLYRAAAVSGRDVRDMVERAISTRQEALLREQERQMLNTYIVGFEQEIEDRRSQLNDKEQQEFDLRRQMQEAQMTLEQLTREQVSLISQVSDAEEIEVRPTPIVDAPNDEMIFLRLGEGTLSIIPLQELMDEFKVVAPDSLWELEDRNEVVVKVGPIGDFKLHYLLRKSAAVYRNGSGRMSQVIQSVRGLVLPVTSPVGVDFEEALQSGSELQTLLDEHSPATTTVTVWLYPDGFTNYSKLNRLLQDRGYTIVTMPLDEDVPIGISPHGVAPAAQ